MQWSKSEVAHVSPCPKRIEMLKMKRREEEEELSCQHGTRFLTRNKSHFVLPPLTVRVRHIQREREDAATAGCWSSEKDRRHVGNATIVTPRWQVKIFILLDPTALTQQLTRIQDLVTQRVEAGPKSTFGYRNGGLNQLLIMSRVLMTIFKAVFAKPGELLKLAD